MKEFYNAYESQHMKNITGDTLRPGGFSLTDTGMEFCNFSREDLILDLGSGMGATVDYINRKYGIKAIGIDPSKKLINYGRKKYSHIRLLKGTAQSLPFENEMFSGVFAECTLSLMENLNSVINEVFRVLKKKGWFVINDVYAKCPEFINAMDSFSVNSCMRGLHDLDILKGILKDVGFHIALFEDCSDMLKQLMVNTIFTYGSMSVFWNKAMNCSVDGCKFENVLRKCKPGYFMMICEKGDE